MRLTRRLYRVGAVGAAFGLATSGLLSVPSAAMDEPGETVDVDILGINDFHGRLEADGQAAGAALLAGAVDEIRGDNPNTVFAAAGDLIGASTFVSFVDDDNPTIDALNAAGLDVSAVGNHEFDKGYCDLVDRVIPRASWEYLGANVKVKSGQTHGCENAELEDLAESWTTELDGVTVGFVGAVTEHLPELVSPDGIASVDVLDVVEETNRVADELKADGADIVVLLVHEGAATTDVESATDPNTDFGAIVTGANANVDAIISGHTHLAYDHDVEVAEWVDEGRTVTERPVVSAGQYGYNLNQLSFTYDTEAEAVTAIESAILPLTVEDDEGNWVPNPEYEPDPEVQAIVDDAVDKAEELGAESLGEITADFNRAQQSDGTENRGGESTLGNFVADVQLAAAQVTDPATQIAVMNPGGLRTDMTYAGTGESDPDGNVTYREAAEVQPFANTLVTLTLTGEQVVQVLEEQWQPDGASRPFLKLGVSAGLTYTYDPQAAAGEHVTSVTFDGQPLDPEGEYRVVANSFLASGGDNFATLAEGTDVADTGQIDLQAMVDYLAANSPAAPDYAQRAVGVSWVSDPDAVYEPGDKLELELSSLLFSTSEPVDETASVTLGGVDLGTVTVDDTIIDTTDEVGRAHISVTVPDDLAAEGAQLAAATETQLVVTLSETGTTVTVPVTVDPQGSGTDDGTETGDETGDVSGTDDGAETGDVSGTDDGAETGDVSGTDDGAETGDETGTDDGTELPDTGSSGIQWWLIIGIAVLVVGGVLYALSRRKGSTSAGSSDS
ncbi:5'-nucleotidase C-terminal domain-containing protein [Haloactinopolyspora sp.]|uniref:5'-nucleotidase C-terminal domain-containing protein n=1 Tax=Haloactinopolyspora sp. TaxID=1966353 RepID=UPI00260F3045|nr:5'-nucleotidase C-terminal domain-containing protein [Haloactinopolyspora sp.]